jgi:hypothetical protein
MDFWREFFGRLLSPQTARFILALLAVGMAQYTMMSLMGQEIKTTNRDALMLALGIVLGLSKDAFSYYFGSTARGDERASEPTPVTVVQPVGEPVPVAEEKADVGRR